MHKTDKFKFIIKSNFKTKSFDVYTYLWPRGSLFLKFFIEYSSYMSIYIF